MKKALSLAITTCLWALAITQVLITRCLIPALQLLLMLLQEAAEANPPEPPAAVADEPKAKPDAAKPTGQQLRAEVNRLYDEGLTSASKIAKATGAARTSVRRWIKARQEQAATTALAGALMPIKAEVAVTR